MSGGGLRGMRIYVVVNGVEMQSTCPITQRGSGACRPATAVSAFGVVMGLNVVPSESR